VTRRQRDVLWGIVLVGFALRLGWALYARADAPDAWQESGDQFSYFHYGSEIARGRGYISYITGEATAYYPIGYPALLGVLFFVVLHTPIPDNLLLAATLLHVVLSTASVALVFVVGRAVASARVGLIAAAVMALFPNLVFQVATMQLETTFIFLVLASMAVLVTHEWETGPPSVRRLLAFGACLGVTVLVRPFAAVLLVGLAGALLAGRVGWQRVLVGVAVPLGVVVLLSVPWTIRNAVQLDAFVPSSTNMGDTLCLDRNLDAKGGFRFADHDGCAPPDLHEVPRNQQSTRKAIRFMLDHPDRELLQIVRRARITFGSDHDGIEAVQSLGSGPFLAESVVDVAEPVADGYFFVVLAMAVAGLTGFASRDHRAGRLVVASGLIGLLVIPLLLWGNPRFHLPLTPFMALSAAFALDWLWRRWRPQPEPEPETA
jgi:4-amino-4-deoxy-L-arabinose transferase-like glycosyltransferase